MSFISICAPWCWYSVYSVFLPERYTAPYSPLKVQLLSNLFPKNCFPRNNPYLLISRWDKQRRWISSLSFRILTADWRRPSSSDTLSCFFSSTPASRASQTLLFGFSQQQSALNNVVWSLPERVFVAVRLLDNFLKPVPAVLISLFSVLDIASVCCFDWSRCIQTN